VVGGKKNFTSPEKTSCALSDYSLDSASPEARHSNKRFAPVTNSEIVGQQVPRSFGELLSFCLARSLTLLYLTKRYLGGLVVYTTDGYLDIGSLGIIRGSDDVSVSFTTHTAVWV